MNALRLLNALRHLSEILFWLSVAAVVGCYIADHLYARAVLRKLRARSPRRASVGGAGYSGFRGWA